MTPAEHNQTQQPNLKAFLDKELPLWRRFAVRLHLARCASCQEEMRVMQQIGQELRGQTIDPLDPGLRSRILATVREMTPERVASVPSRRPALVWGGTAFAALLLVAFFSSRPQFAPSSVGMSSTSSAKSSVAAPSAATASDASEMAKNAPMASPAPGSDSADLAQPLGSAGGSFSGRMPAKSVSPMVERAKGESSPGPADESATLSQIQGESVAAKRNSRPQEAPVLLERASFDLDGYQFVTQGGKRVAVPFQKSLNAVRFARAINGRMALTASAAPPILYLAPADTLVNDAMPGSHWQPLPPGVSPAQPLYVHPAQDWEQFLTMRWYSNMTVVGGLSSADSTSAAFTWLPGSHVQIGPTLYPDFAAYRAFSDAHPEAQRLRAVHDSIPTSPALPEASKAPGSAAGKTRH